MIKTSTVLSTSVKPQTPGRRPGIWERIPSAGGREVPPLAVEPSCEAKMTITQTTMSENGSPLLCHREMHEKGNTTAKRIQQDEKECFLCCSK